MISGGALVVCLKVGLWTPVPLCDIQETAKADPCDVGDDGETNRLQHCKYLRKVELFGLSKQAARSLICMLATATKFGISWIAGKMNRRTSLRMCGIDI